MYLGMLIENKCPQENNTELRIAKANHYAGNQISILKRKISTKTKIRGYVDTGTNPTYGCKMWVMTNTIKLRIETCERNILRNIYRAKQTEPGCENL